MLATLQEVERMGINGRKLIEREINLDRYVQLLTKILNDAKSGSTISDDGMSGLSA